MSRRDKIHELLNDAADELFAFIKESESEFEDRWMPAAEIKRRLDLNMPTVPQANQNQKNKGWVFAALARMLEDKSLMECKKEANRHAFYRSR